MVVVFCMVLIAGVAAAQSPSGAVSCNLVDKAIGKISAGDGVSPVTNAETGPGGWRFNSVGRSFVTFAHTLNDNGTPGDPSDDFYDSLRRTEQRGRQRRDHQQLPDRPRSAPALAGRRDGLSRTPGETSS